MNCLNMENPENLQEWYGVNEHRFCTVLEVKDGKIIWPFFEYHPELWECPPRMVAGEEARKQPVNAPY